MTDSAAAGSTSLMLSIPSGRRRGWGRKNSMIVLSKVIDILRVMQDKPLIKGEK